MNLKKLLGVVAVRKMVDRLPSRRRSPLQRATDPDNLARLAAAGVAVGLAGFTLKKLYDRLRRPIQEGIEHGRELSAAIAEISEAATAATDAAADAESNAGKAIAAVEELGRQLADSNGNGEAEPTTDTSSTEDS